MLLFVTVMTTRQHLQSLTAYLRAVCYSDGSIPIVGKRVKESGNGQLIKIEMTIVSSFLCRLLQSSMSILRMFRAAALRPQ